MIEFFLGVKFCEYANIILRNVSNLERLGTIDAQIHVTQLAKFYLISCSESVRF